MKSYRAFAVVLVLSVVSALSARAASTAFDHAPNNPYGSTMTWNTGDNGGIGFSAWALTTANANGSTAGFFIGSSASNGGVGNIGSIAWGMYANSGDVALATRMFTAGGPNAAAELVAGQQFGVAMDNGNIDANGTVGFNLFNANGVDRLTFEFAGGSTNYVYNLGDGVARDTGVPFTRDGLQILLTIGANNAFRLDITQVQGPTTSITGTLAASDIDRFQFFNNSAGGGSANDLYFNDVSVGTLPTPVVSGAVSRKDHAGTTFDVPLPLTGTRGIEPRSGGPTGDYTLVVSFTSNVTVVANPAAEVISGTGIIGSGGLSNGNAVTVSGSTVTIPLTNVADQQNLQVRLNGVNGGTSVIIPMGVLIGDTNTDGLVNAADATVTRNSSGSSLTSSTFRSDVNVDGSINAADSTVVRNRSGNFLPATPTPRRDLSGTSRASNVAP
ncbi:MAG: dockerin type I domain-containing protein [Verrucomicrobiota bacterium]|nr:dockerin type I domain-containing protein [Verrucomicrobiota bacterium]